MDPTLVSIRGRTAHASDGTTLAIPPAVEVLAHESGDAAGWILRLGPPPTRGFRVLPGAWMYQLRNGLDLLQRAPGRALENGHPCRASSPPTSAD